MKTKQDQAARIAEKAKMLFCGSLGDTATYEAEQIEKAIRKYGDNRAKEERERCVQCAEAETELFDPMPDAVWEWINGNKERTCELAVTIVRATKSNIIKAINGGKRGKA